MITSSATLGAGGLETMHDHLGFRIADEDFDGHLEGDRADFFRQVAPAGADAVGDAAAQLVDAGGDLLQTGAGSRNHADGALADLVGETQAGTLDDGGAAVGSHHQQTFLRRKCP